MWRVEKALKINVKNAPIAFLGIAIILLNVFPAYANGPSEPHNADAMWVEPSSIDLGGVSVGHLFNITIAVNITSTEEVGTWQAKVLFNSTYLNAVKAGYTGVGKSNWFKDFSTMPVDPVINNVAGFVLHGESLVGVAQLSPGAGTLFWIEFNVTSVSTGFLTLVFNMTATYATEDTFIGDGIYYTFTPYDGIAIIPEFSSLILVSSLMVLTLVAVALNKKSIPKPKVYQTETSN
jgi:hypothetical protein